MAFRGLGAKLGRALAAEGIGFGRVYPGTVSTQPGAAAFLAGAVGGEVARGVTEGVLNLPLFSHMRDAEVDHVIATIAAVAERTSRPSLAVVGP